MRSLDTLQDLLVHQLRDLYSAEQQLVNALPKLAKNASEDELKDALTMHLAETEVHVERLEQVFDLLGAKARASKCKGMEGLIDEAKDMLDEDAENEVLDAGIIASAQRIEHYEIAVYGTCREFARALGYHEIVTLLDQTLDEEKAADTKLTELAEGGINALAEQMHEAALRRR